MEWSAYLQLLVCLLPVIAASHIPNRRLLSVYEWKTGQWGRCLGNECDFGGVQRRAIWCESSHGSTASDADCRAADVPPSQRTCFRVCPQHRTLFQWQENDWGPCRQNTKLMESANTGGDVTSCGPSSFGLQERKVMCMEISTTYVQRNEDGSVPSYICEQFAAKPAEVQECITPCAQDCVVTEFGAWSSCSKSCGNGTQSRNRRVVIPPSNGGAGCPPLSETKTCLADAPCEQDEIFSYSPRVSSWGQCQPFPNSVGRIGSDEPATGTMARQLWCQRNDGKTVKTSLCFHDDSFIKPSEHEVCLVPVNCHVSGWSEWSPCSDPCSQDRVTHSFRQRSVLQVPLGRGQRCPDLVQRKTCSYARDQCQRGRYVWNPSDWSECRILDESSGGDGDVGGAGGACGGGLATREVFCTHVNDTTYMPLPDDLCDPTERPDVVTDCYVPCALPCSVGPWTRWGPCISFDCDVPGTRKAKGHIYRERAILSVAEYGGTKCPHLTEHAPCNVGPCYKWVTEETMCQASDAELMCGEGIMRRNVYCINSQELEVDESWCSALTNKPDVEVSCDAPCPSDCVLGDFGPWSECSKTCEGSSDIKGGTQWRVRTIMAHPGPDGAECPDIADLRETRACNHHSCTLFGWLTTEWETCLPTIDSFDQMTLPNEDGMCGIGVQTRNVSCSRINPAKVAPDKRCYEPVRPPKERACDLPCVLDCMVSTYGDWTPCPTTCSQDGSLATQERRRYILQYPQNGGQECPSALQEQRTCNMPDSCYSYTWQAGTWGECRLTGDLDLPGQDMEENCGNGIQTRDLQCDRSDGTVVNNDKCLEYGCPMPPSSQPCRIPCRDDCHMTEWSPWSSCDAKCTGQQIRSRRVHGASRHQAKCYNTDFFPTTETRQCKCPTYRLVAKGSWSSCILDESTYRVQDSNNMECGIGKMYRPAMCLDQDNRYVNVSLCGSKEFLEQACGISCPEDCELKPWTLWKACSGRVQGGIGTTARWQEVIQRASNGGRPCPTDENWVSQTKKCRWTGGQEDAFWQADKWGECDVSNRIGTSGGKDCGAGVQRRTVRCVVPIEHGFKVQNTSSNDCDASRKPDVVQACVYLCPGQCVLSSWTDWTKCPQDCSESEESYRSRIRSVLRNPADSSNGGSNNLMQCESLTMREKCIPGINCFTYTWNATDWSPCQLEADQTCGIGKQDRLLQCLRSDTRIVEVTKCEEASISSVLSTTSTCEVTCPVDCKMTAWSEWSECSETCGTDAVKRRYRSVVQQPNEKGRPCPTTLSQDTPCPAVPCYEWAITPWSECTPLIGDCGAGMRRRNVTCRQPKNGQAVNDSFCLNLRGIGQYQKNYNITLQGFEYLQREHACEVPCPGECHYSTWSDWSACHRSCVQGRPIGTEGIKVRSRASLTTVSEAGCSGDAWETRPCTGEVCYEFEWNVGAWKRGRRDVWCQRSDGLNVTGACTSERPASRSRCNPACHIQSSYCNKDNRCVCDEGYQAIYSMTSGQLESCQAIRGYTGATPEPSHGPSGDRGNPRGPGMMGDAGDGVTSRDWVNDANSGDNAGQNDPQTTPKAPEQSSFLASLPPWVYAIAAVVVLLILIVTIVLCCAKCAPKKKEEEKKPEPDYSMYWDETVQKKYTGEIEL